MDILFPIFSLIILFILTKLMGYRQVTQLNMYDYIIGITLGSIASEFIMSNSTNYIRPLTAMIIYALITYCISKLTICIPIFRKFIEGTPIVLYENNQILFQSLKIAKLDLDEFLMTCRIDNYNDLYMLDKIILETNGRFSYFIKDEYRNVYLKDIKDKYHEITPVILIQEGRFIEENIKSSQKDKKWLISQMKVKNIKLEDIELLYLDSSNTIRYYLNNNETRKYK